MYTPGCRFVRRKIKDLGFTLIELLVTMSLVGVLSAIAIPHLNESKSRALVARTAADLRTISSSFYVYQVDHEDFPPDSHLEIPDGMEDYLDDELWLENTPLGGNYNWEGADFYGYAGISIFDSPASQEIIRRLDTMLDDGDLGNGNFRVMPNGRPTFLLLPPEE